MDKRVTTNAILKMQDENWPETSTPAHVFVMRILRLNAILRQNAQQTMRRFSLSAVEFDTLATLRRMSPHDPVRPSTLSTHLLVTSGGMTRALKSLADRNLIELLPDPEDRRSKNVALTAHGRKVVEQAMERILRTTEAMFGETVSDADLETVSREIGRISARAEENMPV